MISRHNISQNRRMQIMLEKKIKLTEYEEVKEFVHAAESVILTLMYFITG